ncbi:dehydrogenase [Sphingobacterium cellulitidis]|uniref:bi-domain-containing oxidoreductase n=1 Tax=Sphingobacterium cellulitidis TaxID=1768011 RepID=UPI000B94474E|nr:bi-domain-containing oxidoreductase [Sphingobacterium cellulitidis]OYD44529.1 dehydrogenase [Sphingobacterium cellulitidis]
MKQIIQSFKTGETILEEIPAPEVGFGKILIQTTYSLVSLGTERMLVEFGKSNLISKARQQPDKVKQVLDKIKTDGLMPTLEAVFNKLGEPLPLGYCNVGRVIAVGEGVSEFKVGDRVASNGQHAEFVSVPKNLAVHIPDNVKDEEATFTVIGSIGLQGIRLLNPTIGETVVVIGMGLIGLITAQLLLANGCRVIGVDLDETKLQMAKKWGVIPFNSRQGDVVKFIEDKTGDVGADGVIITASAKNNDIISQAARMSRKRGRIVLVGVIGLELNRAEFYEKELTFQVSCSYGPGRYDDNYENKGIDYPLPFVRWTEKRNFETILNAISSKRLLVEEMITEIVPLNDYKNIYGEIGHSKSIASILKYNDILNLTPSRNVKLFDSEYSKGTGVLGIIGAGNFTKMTMLPALKGTNVSIKYVASNGGVSGTALAQKYGIANSTTDYKEILKDEEVDLVLITTRHNLHSRMVIEALKAGKNVFVEKPLALNKKELEEIILVQKESKNSLTVGFNRRFSPHIEKVKKVLGNSPMNVIATMNAGSIPSNVWVHDLKIGGGRIVGEACHFIDLITFLTGSKVKSVCMNAMGQSPEENTDNATILLKYENGSTGVINYFSNGSKAYSKERIEIYSQERTLVVDNFRKTEGYGVSGFSKLSTSLDKGHKNQFVNLIKGVKEGSKSIIPLDEIYNTTLASFAALESLKLNKWIEIDN